MEVKIQKPAYYFSWPDEEILDEKLLDIHGDDETWLYRVDRRSYNGHFQTSTQTNHYHTPSGSVDSRTFTRRKHPLRPSLESVAESPLSNRSSLDLLSASRLNDTKLVDYSATPISTNHGRISSSFTASDKPYVPRVFKLDTPFVNSPFERKRHDSELSDSSIIPSLDSQFDKNEQMTDSLVNFLNKPNEKCQPPAGFQDEKVMNESLIVNFSDTEGGVEFSGEAMTDSMVNFLEPVACQPPSGFGDEEMNTSIVNIDDKDILPTTDMTNSLMDYLECGKMKTAPLTQSTASNEAENIPPDNLHNGEEEFNNLNHTDRLSTSTEGELGSKVDNTFEIMKDRDDPLNVDDDCKISPDISFTNNVNISRTKKEIIGIDEDRSIPRPRNATFEKGNEPNHKLRALNNRDLNVTRDQNEEGAKDSTLSRFRIPNKTNSSILVGTKRLNDTFTKDEDSSRLNGTFRKSNLNSTFNMVDTRLNGGFTKNEDSLHMNGTLTKSNLNSTFNKSRQIPQRNSTFNTTFTKLNSPPKDLSKYTVSRSTEGLDGQMEDDRTSSASDSSFSSAASSTKPRSVDELRTIAQQQESDLVQSSTPTEPSHSTRSLVQLDLELSPIRRMSESRRVTETRSAHSSPVRSPLPRTIHPHPISRLQQPVIETRRQILQASSMSNLAKPRASGLRMPQPSSRMSMLIRPEPRPATVHGPMPTPSQMPIPIPTAIPRPQASRLPMPRFRASGIPTIKRGGRH